MKSRIGFKLVVALVLFSSLITIITTALQLYFDYRVDIKRVNNYEALIRESYLESITTSVWLFDDKQIKTQLNGIHHLPDMAHIQIQSAEGTDWSVGSIPSENNLTQTFSMLYEHKGKMVNIGTLTVVMSLEQIYARLFKKAFTILLSNAVKIFLVSGFILMIFQYLLTRHLNSLSRWLKDLDIGRSFDKFHLDRTLKMSRKPDELDEVVIAINEMQDNLKTYLNDLIKNEKNYRTIFENAVEGVSQSTPEGQFITVNPAFAKILGYESPEELIDKISDIATQLYVDPQERTRYQELLKKSGKVENFEFKALCKNGSQIWVSNSTRANTDQDGKITRYDGMIKDITDRKRAEDTLREREAQMRTLIDTIPDLVWLKDPYGVYLSCNLKFERLYGAKESDIAGKTDYDFVDKKLADSFRTNDKAAMAAGTSSTNEEEVTYADDGHRELLETVKTPMYNNENELIGVLGVARDITERKRTEEEKANLITQLQQAQKMETIGTLAGGIAHDFNNILYPLIGFAEMLQEDLPQDSPEQDNVTEVLHAALRAKDLVKQILTFSRKSDFELKPVKLQAILEEALKLLKSSIPATIEFQTDIDADCGLTVADPTQIHQIIMNLATNAHHAMQETGGRLSVTLKQTKIDAAPSNFSELLPGKYALLKIADTGTGIKKDVLDKIFEPYFTTKETGKGTGLGLSVVQGIVKSCHGDIHVYSEPDKGTQVHVLLPIMKKMTKVNDSDPFEAIQGGTERILLVDDEDMIVKMETQVLERLGYHVTPKTSSVEALNAFKANPDIFDLIISDMTMPNMTGVQLAREIKAVRADIPVIICSGFSDQINEGTSKELGIQGYIMKPVIKKEIAKIIKEVLNE